MWTLAKEHTALSDMVHKGSADWVDDAPRGYDEMVSIFERGWNDLGDGVGKLGDAGWTRKGRILMGGKVPAIYGPSGDAAPS